MNLDVRNEWIEALRSGLYKKGTGSLQPTKDTFCCLGVLCDIAAKKGIEIPLDEDGLYDVNPGGGLIPSSVQTWAGIDLIGIYDGGKLYYDNDTEDYDFNEIANIIEREF